MAIFNYFAGIVLHSNRSLSLMDPLTALSVAGNVVQFIDFGRKILSVSQQIYEDGELLVHEQAARAAVDLANFSEKLSNSIDATTATPHPTANEVALGDICRGCIDVAKTLSDLVGRLKVDGKRKALKSFGAALRTAWKTKDLVDLQRRLSEYRDAINTRLLGAIRDRMEILAKEQSVRTANLEQRIQTQISTALLGVNESLTRDIEAQTLAIERILNRNSTQSKSSSGGPVDLKKTNIAASLQQKTSEEEQNLLRILQLQETGARQTVSEEIIQSLHFSAITERLGEVAEAHRKTFEWVFQEESDTRSAELWSNFVQWLQSGNGIYWINGKAGSGKSTLMKYIYRNPLTEKYLQAWAPSSKVYVAAFFFWNSGTKQQKSQSGLFRSILYDVLRQDPTLVQFVFPEVWSAVYSYNVGTSKMVPSLGWSLKYLQEGFYRLIQQHQTDMRLCLFIDGLDEYEGNDREIAKFFQDATFSSRIKVCVSSRPHIVFQDAFGSLPHLRLQDLTYQDIQSYVLHTLIHDDLMQQMLSEEPIQCQNLADEIVQSASGVFLWVMLVVRSLLNGLGNHDRITDLQRRLRILPKDLETLYEHMVLRIDGIYQQQASQLFQLAAAATDRENTWKDIKPMTVLGMHFAIDENSRLPITSQEGFLSQVEASRICRDMDRILKTRCGGLLEIQTSSIHHTDIKPWMKVSYLHRTAKDFLHAYSTQSVLRNRTGGGSPDAFNADLAILKSFILQLKIWDIAVHEESGPGADPIIQPLVDGVITFARLVEAGTETTPEDLLDEVWRISIWREFWKGECDNMLAIAVQSGLHLYLSRKLAYGTIPRNLGVHRPLLDYAINPTSETERFVSHKVVDILLGYGENPNQKFETPYIHNFGKSTPWINALSYLYFDFYARETTNEWHKIFKLLLEYGADKSAILDGPYQFTRTGRLGKRISPKDKPNASEVISTAFGSRTNLLHVEPRYDTRTATRLQLAAKVRKWLKIGWAYAMRAITSAGRRRWKLMDRNDLEVEVDLEIECHRELATPRQKVFITLRRIGNTIAANFGILISAIMLRFPWTGRSHRRWSRVSSGWRSDQNQGQVDEEESALLEVDFLNPQLEYQDD